MATRHILRIELSEVAHALLVTTTKRCGMTQVAMMSQLITWFAEQPELMQMAILGRYPREVEKDLAKLILKRMIRALDSLP
jgi:hypothetical protein